MLYKNYQSVRGYRQTEIKYYGMVYFYIQEYEEPLHTTVTQFICRLIINTFILVTLFLIFFSRV